MPPEAVVGYWYLAWEVLLCWIPADPPPPPPHPPPHPPSSLIPPPHHHWPLILSSHSLQISYNEITLIDAAEFFYPSDEVRGEYIGRYMEITVCDCQSVSVPGLCLDDTFWTAQPSVTNLLALVLGVWWWWFSDFVSSFFQMFVGLFGSDEMIKAHKCHYYQLHHHRHYFYYDSGVQHFLWSKASESVTPVSHRTDADHDCLPAFRVLHTSGPSHCSCVCVCVVCLCVCVCVHA